VALEIGVANGITVLFAVQESVYHLVKEELGAFITQVQNTLAAKTVMYWKSKAH
jgi:hypothetical protein